MARSMMLVVTLLAMMSPVMSYRPEVVSTSYQMKDLMVEGMQLRSFIVSVLFDEPIFNKGFGVTSANQTAIPPRVDRCPNGGRSRGGGGGPEWPALTDNLAGSVNFTCDGIMLSTTQTEGGMPTYMMATFLTRDVGSTFLGQIGGFPMPEFKDPNGIAFIQLVSSIEGGETMAISGNATEAALRACANKAITIAPGAITDSAGRSATSSPIPITATETTPQCDYDGISAFKAAFDYVIGIAKRLMIDNSISEEFSMLLASLESRDVLAACKRLVAPMFTTEVVTKQLRPTRECFFDEGTPEYMSSPCCNHALEYRQCCAPVTPVVNFTQIKDINTDVIQAQCSNPDRILLSIYSYIDSVPKAGEAPESPSDIGDRWSKYSQRCGTLIYSTKCSVDEDCKYSESCDSSNKQCKVPWGNDANLMLSCFYDEFDPDMRSALAGVWDLNEDDKAGFVSEMESTITVEDCVGQESYDLQSSCSYDQNGCETCTATNRTACLQKKSCNWNYMIKDEQTCIQNNTIDGYDSFCGQCWGDGEQCWSQSEPDICVADSYQTESECTLAGFTWYIRPWGTGECVDATKKSLSSCLPTQVCSDISPEGWGCDSGGSHICYAPDVNETECAAALTTTQTNDNIAYNLHWQSWRNNNTGLCATNKQYGSATPFDSTFCSAFSPGVNGKSVYFFPGKMFRAGKLNTPEKCGVGRCNWQDPMYMEDGGRLSQAQCEQKEMCTQQCPRCRSQQYGPQGKCYSPITNVTQSFDCYQLGGQWQENVVGSTGRCFFQQDAATGSSSACLAYGRSKGVQTQFASCSDLSVDDCADPPNEAVGELGPYLNCYYDMWAQCQSPSECAQAGRCNDDDKTVYQPDKQPLPGSCRVDNQLDKNGWPGDCSDLRSKADVATALTYSRSPMKCTDPVPQNASDCSAIGGQWVTRAITASECLAEKVCYDEGSNYPNGKTLADCGRCGGHVGSLYEWTPGAWENARMEPLTWKKKAFGSVNSWGRRIDYTKTYDMIESAVFFHLGQSQYGELTTKYSLVAKLFQQISCDCTSGHDSRSCFSSIQATPLGRAKLKKGALNTVTTQLGVVKAKTPRGVGGLGGQGLPRLMLTVAEAGTIAINQVTAASVAVVVNSQPNYEVVKGTVGSSQVVGQLAGDGSQITGLTADMSSISVTLNLAQTITVDKQTYPVGGIGHMLGDFVYPMRSIMVTVANDSITTMNITEDGTYFPVFLKNDYMTIPLTTKSAAIGESPAPAPIIAPTAGGASQPATTTPAPTSEARPSSKLNFAVMLFMFIVLLMEI